MIRTINGIPAAAKSLLASSSITPTMRSGSVAVTAIVETPKAELELPVLVEPVRADVPKDALANTAACAVARSVKEASDATLNNWFGLSATKAFTG